MTDQIGTPGSTADTSVNGGKAPKDKHCPFCNQPFTSSSLGRHLDLYIKEKNPKPSDGVHHVDEIRKLRGGITRRQPRNSSSRREDSTPVGTPGQERRSPAAGSEAQGNGNISPDLPKNHSDPASYKKRDNWVVNQGTWETTGVMNHIPPPRNGDSIRNWDGDERGAVRKVDSRNRSVSKQIMAKTNFEEKQKTLDALDRARAAELALRELLGGIRAAKQRVDGPKILDYDPLTFDFPSLILHCLPPPPTLYQSSPIFTASSWAISPPGDQQYQALREHFSSEMRRWRVSCAFSSAPPQDDFAYPPRPTFSSFDDPTETARRAEAAVVELECKISDHLHKVYAQWTSLSDGRRSELWTLELARSVGRKSEDVKSLRREKELAQQEAAHLRMQVDELSRLQHPREFRLVPPTTIPLDSKVMSEVGDVSLNYTGIGFNMMDRNLHLDEAVERVIGRWKTVVKEVRGGQHSMNGTSSQPAVIPTQSKPTPTPTPTPTPNHTPQSMHQPQQATHTSNGIVDMGSDQDADADMEDDDSFIKMTEQAQHQHVNHAGGLLGPPRAPEATMSQAATNFRLANGMAGSAVIQGLENQACAPGYGRIGVQ